MDGRRLSPVRVGFRTNVASPAGPLLTRPVVAGAERREPVPLPVSVTQADPTEPDGCRVRSTAVGSSLPVDRVCRVMARTDLGLRSRATAPAARGAAGRSPEAVSATATTAGSAAGRGAGGGAGSGAGSGAGVGAGGAAPTGGSGAGAGAGGAGAGGAAGGGGGVGAARGGSRDRGST